MGGFDLAWMNQHSAFISHLTTFFRTLFIPFCILKCNIRTINGNASSCSGGHGSMEAGIKLFFAFRGQGNPHVFCEIHCTKYQRIDPAACRCSFIRIDNAFGSFNEQLDGNGADLHTPSLFQLFKFPVQTFYILAASAFCKADTIKTRIDNSLKIVIGHLCFPVVNTNIEIFCLL